jgi:2-polyprenyl-3-methyl-5-hydroxy-6-metoxy-1,4-benzoquinol methylase
LDKHKLEEIRSAEQKSHIAIYSSATLFEKGTWLNRPIKTVMDVLPLFKEHKRLCVLDLGSGVGRNSIPIAQAFSNIECKIECVDILNLAIEKLNYYSEKYNVKTNIKGIVMPLEMYAIRKNYYNLIMAISALEHIESEHAFLNKLEEIKQGICNNGVVCLVVNTDVIEKNKETNQILEPQFEVNLSTEEMKLLLEKTFENWNYIKYTTVCQKYDIPREEHIVELTTNVVTLVAQKQ